MAREHAPQRLFAGSYTEDGGDPGIYTLAFDEAECRLRVERRSGCAPNPSFLTLRNSMLYAAHELPDRGRVAAYAVQDDGALVCRGACMSPSDAGTCHATVHPSGRCLYGADYESGSISCCTLAPDGSPSGGLPSVRHHGSSANRQRQASAHVHSTAFVPGTDVLAAVDLGVDEVALYRTGACGALEQPPAARVAVPAGSGPRMLAFHPLLRLAALVDELANDVLLFRFDAAGLAWRPAGRLQLLDQSAGRGARADDGRAVLAAHPAFSPDGRHLYVSVRGLDEIVLFALDEDAAPTGRAVFPSGGRGPRHFSLSPDGRLLAVANQDSDEAVLFALDAASGAPRELARLSLHRPSCIVWDAEAGRAGRISDRMGPLNR